MTEVNNKWVEWRQETTNKGVGSVVVRWWSDIDDECHRFTEDLNIQVTCRNKSRKL